jgi:DNA polymerase elongation subunit (family B)
MYEWLIDVDLASLYPNTIININISPETKVFRVDYDGVLWQCDDEKELEVIYADKNVKTRKAGDIKAEIKEKEYTLSSYNVAFVNFYEKKGIIPEILDHLYMGRKSKKKESFSYTQKQKDLFDSCPEFHSHGDEYEKVEGIVNDEKVFKAMTKEQYKQYTEFKRQEEICYALQLALKIVLNSIYGYTGTKYSRFYDVDLAMSTTLSGQTITCDSSDMIEDYFKYVFLKSSLVKKKFPNATPKDLEGPVCGYNDTDSIFLSTKIRTNLGILTIGDLFDSAKHSYGKKMIVTEHGHEVVPAGSLECLTFNSEKETVEFGRVRNLIRHKVSKGKWKIKAGGNEVIMTEDHGCMVLREGKLIRIPPKDIKSTDKMVVLKK